MRIERLLAEHAAEAARLEKEVFGVSAWSEDSYRESLELEYIRYVGVWDGEELIGVCGLRNMCCDADITNVMVAPSRRGRGIGRQMLLRLFEEGRLMGVRNYVLEVRVSNTAAIKLYSSLGFVEEGRRRGFYEHPKEDAIIMWKRRQEQV